MPAGVAEWDNATFQLAYLLAVCAGAGFLTGLTAFGGNLIALPLLTFVMEPKDAIVAGFFFAAAFTIALTAFFHKDVLRRECLLLALSSLAGMPAGIIFLEKASPKWLLLAAGLSIPLFILWQVGAAARKKREKPVSILWSVTLGGKIFYGRRAGLRSLGKRGARPRNNNQRPDH